MTISPRILGVFLVLAAGPACGVAAAADHSPAAEAPKMVRIRPGTARLASLVNVGLARSASLRKLVASIEKTDGIVFIEEGRCPRGVAACLTWQVTAAGGYRLLFVVIDTGRTARDVVASVGHELQHVLEVLGDPSLRTTHAIHLFYMSGMSPEGPRAVETAAAEAAGNAVFREFGRPHSAERE